MTQVEDGELPPAYDEHHPAGAEGQSAADGPTSPESPGTDVSRPTPSVSAQQAIAPLLMQDKNTSIKGEFVVNISECKCGPDVLFKTTNGSIQTRVFLRGSVPRHAAVEAHTTNASIKLAVAARDSEQPVDIVARSTNGGIEVALPLDFDGLVTVQTTHGRVTLDPSLQPNTIIVPAQEASSSRSTTYRVTPSGPHSQRRNADSKSSSNNAQDSCSISTTNSGIKLSYDIPKTNDRGKCSDSGGCLIA